MKNLEKAYKQLVESSVTVPHAVDDAYEINELSKETLGSYIKKAKVDAHGHAADHEYQSDQASKMDSEARKNKDKSWSTAERISDTEKAANNSLKSYYKRRRGIAKATSKLTKEQVEEIEALALKHGLVD